MPTTITMAARPGSSPSPTTLLPNSLRCPFFSAAPDSFLFVFYIVLLLISPPSSATATDHRDSDVGTTAWPPLQRPTLSLSISLSVFGEMQANPFGFVIKLPLPQPAEQQDDGPSDQVQPPDQEQEQLLKQGASLQPQVHDRYGPATVKVGSSLISSRWGKCSYTVTIKTSCTSPRVTRDAVSLSFGDASRNEVYAARLDDPASGTFERCSIDTFRVVGPCGGRTCYLYLRRSGRDGWTPEYVKVFYSTGDPRAAVTFFYKVPLPDGVWYGFNLCHGGAATMPSTNLNLDALGKERGDTTDGGHRTTATATPA